MITLGYNNLRTTEEEGLVADYIIIAYKVAYRLADRPPSDALYPLSRYWPSIRVQHTAQLEN